MKKTLLTLSFVIAAISVASLAPAQATGQTGGGSTTQHAGSQAHIHRHKIMLDVLSKMNLSPDQKSKLTAIAMKDAAAMKDLQKQVKAGTISQADAKKKHMEMRKSAMASLHSVLSRDQVKQFSSMMKAEMKKAKDAAKSGK